ncbi:hypothetical protein NPIL_22781 [Nephila pilipes]|uniref:Uncharacterized protein n=1 Tax=Nephila pilipes TaxID=299642 RepID=A0A8X6I8P1_NEPPI|nr:hypothetical protein NPIL_22781 [Nephila pilipes]
MHSRKKIDAAALNHLKARFIINNEDRYDVHSPWVADHILNFNEDHHKERLKSTTKKLLQKNQLDDHEAVFNQWIEEGVSH